MKKISTIFILFLSFLLFLSGCNNEPEPEEKNEMKTKASYASKMNFNSNVGARADIVYAYINGNYTDCIFVYSEEESHGYDDDIIVAWPRENTERILYNLNNHIMNESVDLSPFSLSSPIALIDVVEKWEDVNNLLNSFSAVERDFITDPRHARGFEASEDEESTES